jgi:hypothetical protein
MFRLSPDGSRLIWLHARGTSMQSRNGRPSRPGRTAGGGAVPARPPDGQLTSENPQQPGGADDGGPATDDIQIVLPAAAGQLPPDRPRPPEPPGPPSLVPDELPRRHADPSRPSVPSRLSRRPLAAPEAGPPGGPGPPAPYVRPLPPEPFRPLWWHERPGPAGLPRPSPGPSQPEPSQPELPPSGQRPPRTRAPARPRGRSSCATAASTSRPPPGPTLGLLASGG